MLSGKCLESKSIETNELEWFITKKEELGKDIECAKHWSKRDRDHVQY